MNKIPVMTWVMDYVNTHAQLPTIEMLSREGYTISDAFAASDDLNRFSNFKNTCKQLIDEKDYYYSNGVFAFTTPEMAVTVKLSTE